MKDERPIPLTYMPPEKKQLGELAQFMLAAAFGFLISLGVCAIMIAIVLLTDWIA